MVMINPDDTGIPWVEKNLAWLVLAGLAALVWGLGWVRI